MNLFIGVDPGASGGLAIVHPSPGAGATAVAMPESDRDVWNWFEGIASNPLDSPFAVIEKVGGYVQGNPTPGSAMFTFGQGYGRLLMALTASGIPFEVVTPQAWQKALAIPSRTKDESKPDFKRRLKVVAERRFPRVKVTLSNCDSLLIAEHCRRKHENPMTAEDIALQDPRKKERR